MLIDNRRRNLEGRKNNFITKANSLFNYKFDYSNINYINNDTNIDIFCKEHGIFKQSPSNHLKYGCNKCRPKSEKYYLDFINKSNEKHNNKYTYVKESFISIKYKVSIICPEHGKFEQFAFMHKNGSKCPKCDIKIRANNQKLDKNLAIQKLIDVHGNRYDYSEFEYIKFSSIIKIICKKHGIFKQRYDVHLSGCGCNSCNNSLGEDKISKYLDNHKMKYKREYKFEDCINITKLKYDFYIEDMNTCIEFDGIQHYKPIEYFGGLERFEYMKKCDNIKNLYCLENKIKLIRISYLDVDKIDSILDKLLLRLSI